LKVVEAMEKKLKGILADLDERCVDGATAKEAYKSMGPSCKVSVEKWYAIMDVRGQSLEILKHQSDQMFVEFFHKLDNDSKENLMITPESFVCVATLTHSFREIAKSVDSLELEGRKDKFLDDLAIFSEILKNYKKSVSDVKSAERTHDRKLELSQQKDMKKQQKVAEASTRAPGNAQRAGVRRSARGPVLMETLLPAEFRMAVYDDLAAFETARDEGDVTSSMPYVVKGFNLADLSVATKNNCTLFARDFPNSSVFKGPNPTMRGQAFFKNDDDALSKALLKFAPAGAIDIDPSAHDNTVGKHLDALCYFGRGPKMTYFGSDFHALGSQQQSSHGANRSIKSTTSTEAAATAQTTAAAAAQQHLHQH
jgi:hypothetical protein